MTFAASLVSTNQGLQAFNPVVTTFMNMKKCILTPKLFLNLATLYPSMQPYLLLTPCPCPCLTSATLRPRLGALAHLLRVPAQR